MLLQPSINKVFEGCAFEILWAHWMAGQISLSRGTACSWCFWCRCSSGRRQRVVKLSQSDTGSDGSTKVQLFVQLSTALLLSSRRLKYEKKKKGLHHHLLQKHQYAKQSTLPVYCGEPFQKLMTTSMQIRRNVDWVGVIQNEHNPR